MHALGLYPADASCPGTYKQRLLSKADTASDQAAAYQITMYAESGAADGGCKCINQPDGKADPTINWMD
jgi:hypothetical protein